MEPTNNQEIFEKVWAEFEKNQSINAHDWKGAFRSFFNRAMEANAEQNRQWAPRSTMRQTHTYARLEVSALAYTEIKGKLQDAGYQHAFIGNDVDMHGIAICPEGSAD